MEHSATRVVRVVDPVTVVTLRHRSNHAAVACGRGFPSLSKEPCVPQFRDSNEPNRAYMTSYVIINRRSLYICELIDCYPLCCCFKRTGVSPAASWRCAWRCRNGPCTGIWKP